MVVASRGDKEGRGSSCLMSVTVPVGDVWSTLEKKGLHNPAKAVDAAGGNTWKWLLLWYMNLTPIKNNTGLKKQLRR